MEVKKYDLICVGGGIMTATLALIAKVLKPSLKILIIERLDEVAKESSGTWNNAGTGHSALCELNYTPEDSDGNIDLTKAIKVCNQFEVSKQFWAFLVDQKLIEDPTTFINKVPHHSWVDGAEKSEFLEKRYKAMKENFMFESMEFTRNLDRMKEWFPLIAEGRGNEDIMAATRIDRGTEMNFGALTKQLFEILEKEYDTKVMFNCQVKDIDPDGKIDWTVEVENRETDEEFHFDAEHVFIGAGGGSILLLEKVEIPEKEGYGGFPVSGEWLVCKNEAIIKSHDAKVYGMADEGAPPMSCPHLDTRYMNGKRELLFGPFAGFSTRFLKEGSRLDLFKSLNFDNIGSMWGVFWHNLPLTKYLISEVTKSFEDRMDALRVFMKDAKDEDWEIKVAGQRVQTIKKDEFEGGSLEFGTEVVSSKDGKISCLLGASPGASTAVSIMMEVILNAFPELLDTEDGKRKMEAMMPSWNKEVNRDDFYENLANAAKSLMLD